MEDWGELALLFLDQVDPSHVWGLDLDDVVDTLREGGLTREEAGAVARWLFICLPPHSSDGVAKEWVIARQDPEIGHLETPDRRSPMVH